MSIAVQGQETFGLTFPVPEPQLLGSGQSFAAYLPY
jgi:hypothetical protein